MTDSDLFFEDQEEVLTDDELQRISSTAVALELLEQEISVAEEHLKELKAQHRKISTETLPELMDSVRMQDFTTSDGISVSVSDQVSGSLPKDMSKREAALQWLKDNGGDGLVKDSISVNLDKGQVELANDLMVELANWGVDPERKEDVNHMSLKAFAREQFGAGVDVPFETLGLWRGRVTKLKRKG
jgi:hypothetical protein